MEEESVSGDEEYNEFCEALSETFLFELLVESSSESEKESEPEEEVEVNTVNKPNEETEVKLLLEQTSNKRKRIVWPAGNPLEKNAKVMAIEATDSIADSPKPGFPAIEASSSSIKKKLQSVPMLDYDFCWTLTVADYDSDK